MNEYYSGKTEISYVPKVKYLGNQISSEGTNIDDIQTKCNRVIGTVNKILTILETIYFGIYYFEVGKTMIQSMLLGSILNNIEVAYNLLESEIEKLEQCHKSALRKLMMMSFPCKTSKQMLFF